MKLIIDQQGEIGEKIFDSKEVVIGRLPESDLVFTSMQVSRLHCRIYVAAEFIWVEDLGSSNGTFIDGKRLVPRRPEGLYPSQKIRFGTSEIYIQVVGDGMDPNAKPGDDQTGTGTQKINRDELFKDILSTEPLKAPASKSAPTPVAPSAPVAPVSVTPTYKAPVYQPPPQKSEPLIQVKLTPAGQARVEAEARAKLNGENAPASSSASSSDGSYTNPNGNPYGVPEPISAAVPTPSVYDAYSTPAATPASENPYATPAYSAPAPTSNSNSHSTPYISPPLASYSQALSSNIGGLSEEKSKAKLFEAEQKAMAVLEEAERKAAKIRHDSVRVSEEHLAKVRLQAQEAWNRTQEECESLLNETRNQSQYLFEKSRHDANQLLDQATREREELRKLHDDSLDQDRNSFEHEKKSLIDRLSKEAYLKAQREIELFESESKSRAEKLLIGAEIKAKETLQALEKRVREVTETTDKSASDLVARAQKEAQELYHNAEQKSHHLVSTAEVKAESLVKSAEIKAESLLTERQNEARQVAAKIDTEKAEHLKSVNQWERKKETLSIEVKHLEELKFALDPDVKKTQDTLKSLTSIMEQMRLQKANEEEELKNLKGHSKELIDQAEERMRKALAFEERKRAEHEKFEAERTQFQNEVKVKRERIEKEIIERRTREEEAFSKKRVEEERRLQAWTQSEEDKVRKIEQTHFRNFEHALLQRLTPVMQKDISQDTMKGLLPEMEKEIRVAVQNMIKQGPALTEQVGTGEEAPPIYRNRRFQVSMSLVIAIFGFAAWQIREDHNKNPQAQSAISVKIEEKRAIAAAFTIPTSNKFHESYMDNVLSTTNYVKMKQNEKIQGEWIVNLNNFLVEKFRFKEGTAVKVISAESVLVQDLQKLREDINPDSQKDIEKKMRERENEYNRELISIGLKQNHINAIREREKKFLSGYLEMMGTAVGK